MPAVEVAASGSISMNPTDPAVMYGRLKMSATMAAGSKKWSSTTKVDRCRQV